MSRICFVLVAGLDQSLRARGGNLPTLGSFVHRVSYEPALPAVTSTAQATLTTGVRPDQHGIICNGLYTHGRADLQAHLDLSSHAEARRDVSFWEQSNTLLQHPRFWQAPGFPKKKVAMLFWQNSMRGAADVVITPKPEHTPDGKTLTACWSNPAGLYPTLVRQIGPFPLHNYWSPMAGIGSSQWIVKAAQEVWQNHKPDLQLVYIPHMDYNLQRLGPSHAAIPNDLGALDGVLAPLAAEVREGGGILIVAGDYGMYGVNAAVLPNAALRKAGLLKTRGDAGGKLLVDYDASAAFVMADHQVGFVYAKPGQIDNALRVLTALPGVERAVSDKETLVELGLATPRAGDAVLLASPSAWFAHDWWFSDEEKPAWQFSVDIHNKPGYDPRELFFDPQKKCIAQNTQLVKGSHGLTDDLKRWPVILSDVPLPGGANLQLKATQIAPALARLLGASPAAR